MLWKHQNDVLRKTHRELKITDVNIIIIHRDFRPVLQILQTHNERLKFPVHPDFLGKDEGFFRRQCVDFCDNIISDLRFRQHLLRIGRENAYLVIFADRFANGVKRIRKYSLRFVNQNIHIVFQRILFIQYLRRRNNTQILYFRTDLNLRTLRSSRF